MKRIDIIGLPGAGKSTFLNGIKLNCIISEDLLIKKIVFRYYKYLKLFEFLPSKFRKVSYSFFFKRIVSSYSYEAMYNKNTFLRSLLIGQQFVTKDFYTQYKRLCWFIERFETNTLYESFYEEKNLVSLCDESLLQKYIAIYLNIGDESSSFEEGLNSLPLPTGIVIFENNVDISVQRVLNRRVLQKGKGRLIGDEGHENLIIEAKKYITLIDKLVKVVRVDHILHIDLTEDEEYNRLKLLNFVSRL